jgi:hypothetical protein
MANFQTLPFPCRWHSGWLYRWMARVALRFTQATDFPADGPAIAPAALPAMTGHSVECPCGYSTLRLQQRFHFTSLIGKTALAQFLSSNTTNGRKPPIEFDTCKQFMAP